MLFLCSYDGRILLANSENLTPQLLTKAPPSLQGKVEPESPSRLLEGGAALQLIDQQYPVVAGTFIGAIKADLVSIL